VRKTKQGCSTPLENKTKHLCRYEGDYLVVEKIGDARPIQNPKSMQVENEEGVKEWRFCGNDGMQEWIGIGVSANERRKRWG
jgi:hypothetical protein